MEHPSSENCDPERGLVPADVAELRATAVTVEREHRELAGFEAITPGSRPDLLLRSLRAEMATAVEAWAGSGLPAAEIKCQQAEKRLKLFAELYGSFHHLTEGEGQEFLTAGKVVMRGVMRRLQDDDPEFARRPETQRLGLEVFGAFYDMYKGQEPASGSAVERMRRRLEVPLAEQGFVRQDEADEEYLRRIKLGLLQVFCGYCSQEERFGATPEEAWEQAAAEVRALARRTRCQDPFRLTIFLNRLIAAQAEDIEHPLIT